MPLSSPRRTTILRRLRRTLRVAGVVLGWTVAAVLVVVLLVLGLAPSRRLIMNKGLEIANDVLPGTLTIERADWPRLGHFEFDGLLWVDEADTLARMDTLRATVDISDLLKRDVTVRMVRIAGVHCWVPAIMERFPAPLDTLPAAEQPPAEPPPFPRPGSLPPVPSLAIEELQLQDIAATVAPGQTVVLDSLGLEVEFRHGRESRLAARIQARPLPDLGVSWRVSATCPDDTLRLDLAPFHILEPARLPGPSTLALTGKLQLPTAQIDSFITGEQIWPILDLQDLTIVGRAGTWDLDAHVQGRQPARLDLRSRLKEAPTVLVSSLSQAGADTLAPGLLESLTTHWATHDIPGLDLTVEVNPPPAGAPLLETQVTAHGRVLLPALKAVAPLLPPQLVIDDLGPIAALLDLSFDGRAQPPSGRVALDLSETDWLDTFILQAHGDTSHVVLDSLAIRMPGLDLMAQGTAARDAVTLDLGLDIPDASLFQRWREPGLAPGDGDTLGTGWMEYGTPGLDLSLKATPPRPQASPLTSQLTIHSSVRLPAPGALGPLLPPQLVIDNLGPLVMELDGAFDGLAQPPNGRLTLDLGDTPWLDTFRLEAHGDTNRVVLDSLAIHMPGLDVVASGMADRDSVHAAFTLDLPDATLLSYWDDPQLDGAEVHAHVDLASSGSWPMPTTDLRVEAGLSSPAATVPDLQLSATASPDTLTLDFALPEGAATPQQDLDHAAFSFHGAAGDSLRHLRGDLRLEAQAPRLGMLLDGHLDAHDLLHVPRGTLQGDTLSFSLNENRLASSQPWELSFDAADSALSFTGFQMAGSLGHLNIDAHANPDSLAANLGLAMAVVLETILPFLPPGAELFMPEGTLTAEGAFQAAGKPLTPFAHGGLDIGITENPDVEDLTISTKLALATGMMPPPGIEAPPGGWRKHSARVNLALKSTDKVLAEVSALVPLPQATATPDSALLSIDADAMDLALLEPLVPPGSKIAGSLDADVAVAGLMTSGEQQPDLDLSGGLSLSDFRADGPDGSWITLHGQIEMDGTSLEPDLKGSLDIEGGLIRIPDPPPTLLPVKGEALLWDAAAQAPLDTMAAATDTTVANEALAAIMPNLVFAIKCPGSLWLRGQGLDIELAGDLALHLRQGKPAVEGELEALQGTMKQLGHVFRLERGRITFFADEKELNPDLDLILAVKVSSYTIKITVSGTANDPLLEFSSEPSLSDGDIISTLLFGKPASELDEGQSGLMADRAGQLALAYGSQALQESVAKELGVDVVSIAPREGNEDTSSLTVGKYINPKVMVRYEQLLEGNATFLVHLDYNLTRDYKLHTQVSQGEASGVEIKWEKDW